MNTAVIILFISTLINQAIKSVPGVHIIVDLQPKDNGMISRIQCGINDGRETVYLVSFGTLLLSRADNEVKHAALHEICHIIKHKDIICSQAKLDSMSKEDNASMEWEADRCAFSLNSK